MYRIPTDISQEPPRAADWPIVARIRAAMAVRPKAPAGAKLAAVAITMNEQPGRIWNGNCCGIMSQGVKCGWGWFARHWTPDTMPTGYVLLKEGQTGRRAPFLAFSDPKMSLAFLIDRCVSRNIGTGYSYAVSWVGTKPATQARTDAIKGFDFALKKVVVALWGMATVRLDRDTTLRVATVIGPA